MKFFTGYDDVKARKVVKEACGLKCLDDSRTVQADARDADINVIMSRYQKTGQLPPLARLPSYGDFDQVSDFRTALELVRQGEHQFMQLPAAVRARFDNDPAAFSEFASDPGNHLELVELGVVRQEVADEILAKAQKAQSRGSRGGSASTGSGGSREAVAPDKNRAKAPKGGE